MIYHAANVKATGTSPRQRIPFVIARLTSSIVIRRSSLVPLPPAFRPASIVTFDHYIPPFRHSISLYELRSSCQIHGKNRPATSFGKMRKKERMHEMD
jgi:hypothetical protein